MFVDALVLSFCDDAGATGTVVVKEPYFEMCVRPGRETLDAGDGPGAAFPLEAGDGTPEPSGMPRDDA
jgi:hypothetical protein